MFQTKFIRLNNEMFGAKFIYNVNFPIARPMIDELKRRLDKFVQLQSLIKVTVTLIGASVSVIKAIAIMNFHALADDNAFRPSLYKSGTGS